MSDKEIEDIINKIAKERDIKIEYLRRGETVKVSSPETTLVGSTVTFNKAMREVAYKYKQ